MDQIMKTFDTRLSKVTERHERGWHKNVGI